MNQPAPHDFEPFSEITLKAVEIVEHLPNSIAFENMLYNNRLMRRSIYEFSHKKGDTEDFSPLVVSSSLMTSQFPVALRQIFPQTDYSIEQLVVTQIEGSFESPTENTSIRLSFIANGLPHSVITNGEIAQYETVNDYLDSVSYNFKTEDIIGLIAFFTYAKQYDPEEKSQKAIELVQSVIDTDRNQDTDLVERMIMTLGDYSGQSKTETQAMFDNPAGAPIIATLTNKEFPDKSALGNTLSLNEIDDINEMPTSIDTTLYQNIVHLEDASSILGAGVLENRYAEQRSMVLSALPFPTSELIDPNSHFERWARTCSIFLGIIEAPMESYAHLDSSD